MGDATERENPSEAASTGQCGSSKLMNCLNGARTDEFQMLSKRMPGSSVGEVGLVFAMDGAATIVMTGWRGAEALAGLKIWVTSKIKPTGSLRSTLIRGFIGVKVVGFRAPDFSNNVELYQICTEFSFSNDRTSILPGRSQ